MKKTNKLVAGIAAAVLATAMVPGVALATSANAQKEQTKETKIDYSVQDSYSWTVPNNFSFNGDANHYDYVKVENNVVAADEKTTITLDPTNDFKLTDASGTVKRDFGVSEAEDFNVDLQPGDTVLSVPSGKVKGEQRIVFKLKSLIGDQIAQAGEFTGKVTFDACVVKNN